MNARNSRERARFNFVVNSKILRGYLYTLVQFSKTQGNTVGKISKSQTNIEKIRCSPWKSEVIGMLPIFINYWACQFKGSLIK
jgi:hypothetical protein